MYKQYEAIAVQNVWVHQQGSFCAAYCHRSDCLCVDTKGNILLICILSSIASGILFVKITLQIRTDSLSMELQSNIIQQINDPSQIRIRNTRTGTFQRKMP